MNQQITIEISERVWQRASILAEKKHKNLKNVLENWLEETVAETPLEELSDNEILALTELQFTDRQQEKFSKLLEKNRESSLNNAEKFELDELMHIYETGLLQKSKAFRVAVERGLIEPLGR